MADFAAPVRHIQFTLEHICGFDAVTSLENFSDATPDVVEALLEAVGKLANGVLAPLNQPGDRQASVLENGVVRPPDGFKAAYREFVDGGWNGLASDPEYGGQGLPFTLSVSMMEMVTAANMAFALCPMLNLGAIEAVRHHADDRLKALYLEKMVTGMWTSTMNLTEPQAGSDVGALTTRAEPRPGGGYRLTGQKIFITWGEHDMTENIVHLVLARTPGAPPGTRGISLFLVPKIRVGDDGTLGAANDLRCVSLEHKLGIHASPTAVMSFGDNGDCEGYLLGREHKGMACMFTMMNHARLNVGLQGAALAERATQAAWAYAMERRQGRAPGASGPGPSAIIDHADVRRMVMTMKALTEGARALVHRNAVAVDLSIHHPDSDERARQAGLAALLTPISKGWSTDMGCEVASIGVQVHGGMGFIEETGAAQYYRDARIAPIYEGTNGIQGLDLVTRKLTLDGGRAGRVLSDEIAAFIDDLPVDGPLAAFTEPLAGGLGAMAVASRYLVDRLTDNPRAAQAGATPFLHLAGYVIAAYLLARGARAAQGLIAQGNGDREFLETRIAVARFFAEQLLPRVDGLLAAARGGDDTLFSLTAEQLSA